MNSVQTMPVVADRWPEPPRLLVEWSSPWEEFKTALAPALSKSGKALAGEAPIGIFPYRGMLASWLLECVALVAVIVLPEHIASLQPYQPPPRPKWDVVYYYGDELPQTQDTGGAQEGKSGPAGGQEAYHRTQTIRVARGERASEKVVDAPKLDMPPSDSAVANLLAFKPLPGPPPTEGLRSSLAAPALPNAVVAPAPDLNSASTRKPDELMTDVVPPAPEVSHPNTKTSPLLSSSVVAPAPDIARDKMRNGDSMSPSVIAPPPREAPRDLASSRSPLTATSDVVAPPVSAPARAVSASSRLSLPAPAVVAPPPSQVSRDLNSWGSTVAGNLRTNPVPPPPNTLGGGGSKARGSVGTLAQQVVPPPVNGTEQGLGGRAGGRLGGSALGSVDVVPPPPSLGGGKALSGSGSGTKGAGAGGLLDLGSSVAPPTRGAGGASGNAVVVSSQPGTKPGVPNSSGGGAIAMSPSGTAKAGLGGSGGGAGIDKGRGPGSGGMHGEASGAGKEGTGHGADPNAQGGISPSAGKGGAGGGANGAPAVPGVSVQGGTTQTITLPSFGADDPASATGPGRSSAEARNGTPVTVKGTSRSGGAFRRYDYLKGDNYSIYLETSLGMAVMQFADAASVGHNYAEDLTAPEPIRIDLPEGLHLTHVEFACILDRSGALKDIRVLTPGAAETTSKILAALPNWKFRPAFRGNEPVEVNAILGFGVDTR